MKQKAIIFHGTGGNPDVAWYAWLGEQLREKGFEVEIPSYPDINVAPIATFLPKVLSSHQFDSETTLIGHSAGAALLLSLLEHLDSPVKQAFLAAGYATQPNDSEEPVLQSSYNWEKIAANVKDIYFINSTDDPYGCDDKQGALMFSKLGGTQIICKEGHFGSEWQEYNQFELLNKLIN
jgi:predicted alpha/beta hydrolase family esterase